MVNIAKDTSNPTAELMDLCNSTKNQANTSKTASRTAASVRQPVSCEPCRRRKIKCSRTQPPCTTCQRRGCASSCVYAGRHDVPVNHSGSSSLANEELLARITNLENILTKKASLGAQIPLESVRSEMQMLSPPVETASNHAYDLYVSLLLYSTSHVPRNTLKSNSKVGV